MNYLLICPRSESKMYTDAVKTVKTATVLDTVNEINPKLAETLKDKYNPHGLIVFDNFTHSRYTAADFIADVKAAAPNIRVIYINPSANKETISKLYDLHIYDVISRSVTDREFEKVINEPMTKDMSERLNGQKAVKYKLQYTRKLSVKPFLLIGGVAGIFLLIVLVLLAVANRKATAGSAINRQSSISSMASSSNNAVQESDTISFTADYTETITHFSTTEKDIELPTEIISSTSEAEPEPEEPPSDKQNIEDNKKVSSEQPQQADEPQPQQQQPQQQQPKQQQPAAVNVPTTIDPQKATLTVGQNLTINVSGTATVQGVSWSIDNKAIISFSGGDITHVTVTANGKGVGVITGVVKSSGEVIYCVVTVK